MDNETKKRYAEEVLKRYFRTKRARARAISNMGYYEGICISRDGKLPKRSMSWYWVMEPLKPVFEMDVKTSLSGAEWREVLLTAYSLAFDSAGDAK